MNRARHPVDEVLPIPRLCALGLQHVLVMYANAVAVPLIVGGALHLPKDQLAMLINADLFACGIATLIQTIGFGKPSDLDRSEYGCPSSWELRRSRFRQCSPWRRCRESD
jgi:xanthine/uracil permease